MYCLIYVHPPSKSKTHLFNKKGDSYLKIDRLQNRRFQRSITLNLVLFKHRVDNKCTADGHSQKAAYKQEQRSPIQRRLNSFISIFNTRARNALRGYDSMLCIRIQSHLPDEQIDWHEGKTYTRAKEKMHHLSYPSLLTVL